MYGVRRARMREVFGVWGMYREAFGAWGWVHMREVFGVWGRVHMREVFGVRVRRVRMRQGGWCTK